MYMQEVADNELMGGAFEEEENIAFDDRSCGICTDIVIDRGVLDCCQHWFCFTCIDNWATITNRCPLCKNEFQCITCLPVYDTTGTFKADGYSLYRDDDDDDDNNSDSDDDDWCVQGENNTLSFPSYYIDEDAVICLDGNQCKIRCGSLAAEGDTAFDTSIACDSCDIWYHAVCVGFNPGDAYEESWLCPRCISADVQHKPDAILKQNVSGHSIVKSGDHGWGSGTSLSGKVEVSVADDGETAIVVSMVGAEHKTESCKRSPMDRPLDVKAGKQIGTFSNDYDVSYTQLDVPFDKDSDVTMLETADGSSKLVGKSSEVDVTRPDVELMEKSLVFSPIHESALNMATIEQENNNLKLNLSDRASLSKSSEVDVTRPDVEMMEKSLVLSPIRESALSMATSEQENNNLKLNLSDRASFSSSATDADLESAKNNEAATKLSKTNCHMNSLRGTHAGDKMVAMNDTVNADATEKMDSGYKGWTETKSENHESQLRDTYYVNNHIENRDSGVQMESEYPVKKAKLDEMTQKSPSRFHSSACETYIDMKSKSINKSNCVPEDELAAAGIMDIVREIDPRSRHREADTEPVNMEKGDKSRLRVKKIMRRKADESSIVVQKLREEIRVVVGDRASMSSVKDDSFDEELLTAFRAVIGKTEDPPGGKSDPSFLRTRKLLLQKGKVRENLTKKIYGGMSTGRRRHAWERDREVEFWKYRCCSGINREKVETLQSVLDLLRKTSDPSLKTSERDRENPVEATDSILSRVYIADASVFPRRDDIKPLSALNNCGDNVLGNNSGAHEVGVVEGPKVLSGFTSNPKIPTSGIIGKSCSSFSLKRTTVSGSNKPTGEGQSSQMLPDQPDCIKRDKRKWALEILARKNASSESIAAKNKSEGGTALKGNYPLLSQLPTDMRPVLADSRHNKIPIAVRQVQLYRVTEHYLRRTNLAAIRRTAEIELAVADAVNIEKDILERSNSKLVYLNLCSQVLRTHANPTFETNTCSSTEITECSDDQVPVEAAIQTVSTGSSVEEALRRAGLFSDSPPTSPGRQDAGVNDDPAPNTRGEGSRDITDMNCQTELGASPDVGSDSRTAKLEPRKDDCRTSISPVIVEELPVSREADGQAHCTPVPIGPNNFIVEAPSDVGMPLQHQQAAANDVNTDTRANVVREDISFVEHEEPHEPENPTVNRMSNEVDQHLINKSTETEVAASSVNHSETGNNMPKGGAMVLESESESCAENITPAVRTLSNHKSSREDSPTRSMTSENAPKAALVKTIDNKVSDTFNSISRKVEAYIKEHIRPLCKSGVITVEQYRWSVAKTTDKVMKYHQNAKNANFLIKEGDKVKKLALQYVEAAQKNCAS